MLSCTKSRILDEAIASAAAAVASVASVLASTVVVVAVVAAVVALESAGPAVAQLAASLSLPKPVGGGCYDLIVV